MIEVYAEVNTMLNNQMGFTIVYQKIESTTIF